MYQNGQPSLLLWHNMQARVPISIAHVCWLNRGKVEFVLTESCLLTVFLNIWGRKGLTWSSQYHTGQTGDRDFDSRLPPRTPLFLSSFLCLTYFTKFPSSISSFPLFVSLFSLPFPLLLSLLPLSSYFLLFSSPLSSLLPLPLPLPFPSHRICPSFRHLSPCFPSSYFLKGMRAVREGKKGGIYGEGE